MGDPQVVAHQGTNPARYCLTSVADENWCFQCGMVLDIIICSGKRTSSQYQKWFLFNNNQSQYYMVGKFWRVLFVTGPAKINHVSTNHTELYFR